MRYVFLAAALFSATSLRAEVPQVVADIPPVHSLVAQVMSGLGTPDLLLTSDASAHEFALKPSQARALSNAALVVTIGPDFSPGLARSIEALAEKAQHIHLAEHPDSHHLALRAEDEDDHDDHGHDHDHDHGDSETDPHLWLDPDNGGIWLSAIAEALSQLDPDNADTYRDNATIGQARITEAQAYASATLAPSADKVFVLQHDALIYYETAFGLNVLGAVSDSHDAAPGPARLSALRSAAQTVPPTCILAEPNAPTRLAETVFDGMAVPIARIDGIGETMTPGPDLYPLLLETLADTIATCAKLR